MNKRISYIASAACLMLLGTSAFTARAGQMDHETIITLSAPAEIPGQVLAPGTYVFQRLGDDPNIMQIFTKDGHQPVATLHMMPEELPTVPSEAMVTLAEEQKGAPPAIEAWYYPGDSTAEEFVYPHAGSQKPLVAQTAILGTTVY